MLLAVLLSGAMGAAPAQGDVPDKQDAPPIELPTMVVEGKAPKGEGPLLPSELQVEGHFGDGRAVAETPRAVTSISSDLIERAAVVELYDLQRLVPNSYGANTFGVASLPSFRGQLAEIFQDGLRRQGGNNGLGLPLSLNSFGQIDAIKGPPPVVLGSTQRVGGFVNLIPKRPDLDGAAGSLSVGGGTWDRYRQQLDYSTPIDAGRSAVRLSVENRNEDSFYDFTRYDSQSLFAAYRLKPAAGSVLDVNFEYFNVDFTDNAGWNRATQDLIDNGIYITGQGVQPNGSTVPGPNAVVSPTGTVRLPRSRVLTDPADRNNSETMIANLRYETDIRPGFKLINR
ncbi:MAG: TonB-dependent receptor plug domain-containing protein, partial [Burkholderiales bacterium]